MANILTYNTDLIFSETNVELEMLGVSTPASTIAKIQDDLLSTGSISTFHSTMTSATTNTCAMRCSTAQSKTTKPKANTTTKSDSVTSLVTLSESDLQILLTRLVQALHMKIPTITTTLRKSQPEATTPAAKNEPQDNREVPLMPNPERSPRGNLEENTGTTTHYILHYILHMKQHCIFYIIKSTKPTNHTK